MCTKKKFDVIGAMWAIAQAKHSQDKRRQEIRYYWCKYCSAYHLSSKPKRIKG